MKLADRISCDREMHEANIKTITALGDTIEAIFSDRGSIPLASTNKVQLSLERLFSGLLLSIELSALLLAVFLFLLELFSGMVKMPMSMRPSYTITRSTKT